jgi:hypothetical protein
MFKDPIMSIKLQGSRRDIFFQKEAGKNGDISGRDLLSKDIG